MEEQVGQIWDKWIQSKAYQGFPEDKITFDQVSGAISVYFRALGGETAKKILATGSAHQKSKKSWLQKLSGTGDRAELSWQNAESLCLPSKIDVFPDKHLNRKLYFWLSMLQSIPEQSHNWLEDCAKRTIIALTCWPGFKTEYQTLVGNYLELRPPLNRFNKTQRALELIIRKTLLNPEQNAIWPKEALPPHPVLLWPDPISHNATQPSLQNSKEDENKQQSSKKAQQPQDKKKRKAKRVEDPDGKDGMLLFRFESIFSQAEQVNVDRCTDDDEDDNAIKNADDMEELSISRGDSGSGKLKLDLDLPGEEAYRLSQVDGILLPEWDYREQRLKNEFCRLIDDHPDLGDHMELPEHLKRLSNQLKRQFSSLLPHRIWLKNQTDGDEIDLDAWQQFTAEKYANNPVLEPALYQQLRANHRDLSCFLLADLSLSTDAWVNNEKRVIDVIKETLYLFAESLSMTGDRFAMGGFWSKKNDLIRFVQLKKFNEKHNGSVRQRIAGITPGYYTRMGAAIRRATQLLENESTSQRLLLLLTDGKPNDLDLYEGRYGIEDTRHAIAEARKKGILPFAITIDRQAESYLPYIFGKNSFSVLQHAEELPKKLPALYAKLTDLA